MEENLIYVILQKDSLKHLLKLKITSKTRIKN